MNAVYLRHRTGTAVPRGMQLQDNYWEIAPKLHVAVGQGAFYYLPVQLKIHNPPGGVETITKTAS